MRAIFSATIVFLLLQGCAWAGDDWTLQNPDTEPPANHYHDMAYVGGSVAVLFGGYYNSGYGTETWVFDASDNTWTQKSPSSTPTGRRYHAMGFIGDDQAILFGGRDLNGSRVADTWIYDLSSDSWTQNTPSTAPSGRQDHALAFVGGDQVVLFGGYDGSNDNETWLYDLSENTWTNKAPTTKPSARYDHALAYIGGDQVLLFGGYDGSNDNETWLYDLSANTWTNKSPSSPPEVRIYHAMAYIGGDQVLLFGGRNSGNFNDTWIYDLSANTWTEDSNSSVPSARYDHAISETSMNGGSYLVMFGGSVSSPVDETWTFGGGDYSLPVVLSSFTASLLGNGEILLSWVTDSEFENLGFIVERRALDGLWTEIASYLTTSGLQGQGSVSRATSYSVTDKSVEDDLSYEYRLADISYSGEKVYHNMQTVSISAKRSIPEAFTLEQAFPNPFNSSTLIRYHLSQNVPIKLVVYDVHGRVVSTLVYSHQQPGRYQVDWQGRDTQGHALTSGVYFCQLESQQHSETIKLVLLR